MGLSELSHGLERGLSCLLVFLHDINNELKDIPHHVLVLKHDCLVVDGGEEGSDCSQGGDLNLGVAILKALLEKENIRV